ncbi:MAG: protein kinase [Acidobacteriota bacterium]|nr:protein kinase [Blastocatellia bacterium]MDW8411544.1 protein kinase [Acidobacteriota bacterium]
MLVGKTIAQYKIVEALGKGGMGKVCKAIDINLNRTVVLKLLARELLKNENARKRFLREARLASALDHPNICTIYEIQETEGFYYIAMQYIEGQTLKKVINNRPLSARAIISISLQVADALAAAHDCGIIHRDIKPQNIMLTPRGQVKILDFGLAKGLEEHTALGELTEHGQSLGTPSYMSPEQARGEPVDKRTDIFSFGIVLYEMATGRKPFSAENNIDLLYMICNTPTPRILDVNPRAMPQLQSIIDRATAKTAADRYRSMQEVLAELKAISSEVIQVSQVVPDGIHRDYTPVVRSRWRSFLRFFLGPKRTFTTNSPVDNTPKSVSKPPQTTVEQLEGDDFPLIPGQHKTLAVLPFRIVGTGNDEVRLSLLDLLVTELTKFRSLTIRPSSYVLRYLNQEANPVDVGKELGVDAVLLGSIIGTVQRMRVTAQLVNATTGGILWAGKVDASDPDPIRLQDTTVKRLVAQMSDWHKVNSPYELLSDESEELRLEAVAMLKFSKEPKAVEALGEALYDSSINVKFAAAEALSKFGKNASAVVLSAISDSLRNRDYTTARYAINAAGRLADPEFVPVLLEALSCQDTFVASEAALALGHIKDRRAVSELVDALLSNDASVRFTAAHALGELADPAALSGLTLRLCEDEDEGVRAKARWAINAIRKRT